MKRSDIVEALPFAIQETDLDELGMKYSGKVRDTYSSDDQIYLVTTDRISAFDHILHEPIPFKGQVLNELAAYFFRHTSGEVPNHLIDVPDPNVTVARRCEPVKLEFVVRGYLAGHAWREYNRGKRSLCGITLPDGLRQNSQLPEPILTPATKAASGHDEDISAEDTIARGIIGADAFQTLRAWALTLFDQGTQLARDRGLILVDTKYEFGRSTDGDLLLIDEIHTPDSSRYFYRDTYEQRLAADEPQRQLSKEFVREWLMEQGFQGKEGQSLPHMPDSFRVDVALRYIELYETLTGESFTPPEELRLEERLRSSQLLRTAGR